MKTIMSKQGLGGMLILTLLALALMVCTGHGVTFISDAATVGAAASSGFPKPDYDSGWISLSTAGKPLTHNLGGNVNDYVVDVQSKVFGEGESSAGAPPSNQGVGMIFTYDNLTPTSISLFCAGGDFGLFDYAWDALVRVRIWVCGSQSSGGNSGGGSGGSSTDVDLFDLGESYRSFEPQVLYAGVSGQQLSMYFCIANGGTVASSPTPIRFYASTDTNITTSDYMIGYEGTLPSIDPGTAISCYAPRDFPTNIPAGTYYIGWIIDPYNTVSETNKSNNTAYKTGYKLTVR